MHVDDFIDDRRTDAYASWFLNLARLPATLQIKFRPFTEGLRLFCTWRGRRWRVTGASRMGDVWLVEDHSRDCGHDERVDVSECTEWGREP